MTPDDPGSDAMADQLLIRGMTRAEVDTAVEWAASEGWNPGLHDAELFWGADPDGWYAAELGGELIGTGSAVSYDGAFGFIGFFIVRPDLRGQGIGGRLWPELNRRLAARMAPHAAISIEGVFEVQPWYTKGGFVFERRDIRYRAIVPTTPQRAGPGTDLVDATTLPFDRLVAYDAGGFGVPRARFLEGWLRQPAGSARAVLDGDDIVGFGVIRRCREGAKIGPLFADDEATARALYDDLAATVPGEPIFLDVPETNTAAVAFADERGMEEVFGCARMSVGTPPPTVPRRVWGVTTFELG